MACSYQVFALTPISDQEIFQSCFNTPPIGECVKSDFNNDGLINSRDFSQFNNALRGDFNDDGIVDLIDNATNQDRQFLMMCIEQNAQPNCMLADLNSDELIDNLDLDVFNSFIIFDLNNDNIIFFRINSSPIFQNINDITTKEGESTAFYIWANDIQNEVVTYILSNVPDNASYTSVVMGDVNSDGAVDEQDISLVTLSIQNIYDQRFDLNNDAKIDKQDVDLSKSLFGKTRQAILFDWTPGVKQSGFYYLSVSAQAQVGASAQIKIKISVFDLDAITNYYSYDDVLLIVNSQSEASKKIGQYFSESRGIPTTNIVTISTPESETITRSVFEQDIRLPIEAFISSNMINSEINYIVTTKGVPLRITNDIAVGDQASVDSELSMILGPFADQIGAVNATPNPYYNYNIPFSSEMFGIYLVTRLTGYTVSDVLTLIDRSAIPEQYGTFILDVDPTKDNAVGFEIGNKWLRDAADILKKAGQLVLLDETTTFVTQQTHVLGYASWGSNDANDTNNAKPNFVWLPGSIAETFVSTSARTFTSPAIYGQSLVADLIAEGITGVKGYVFEPILSAMAKPHILFDRYSQGYILADSYFSASASIGWQGVVIGDPKMAINNNLLQRKENDNEDDNEDDDEEHDDEHADEDDDDKDSKPDLDAAAAADDETNMTTLEESSGSGSVGPWAFYLLFLVFLNRLIRQKK